MLVVFVILCEISRFVPNIDDRCMWLSTQVFIKLTGAQHCRNMFRLVNVEPSSACITKTTCLSVFVINLWQVTEFSVSSRKPISPCIFTCKIHVCVPLVSQDILTNVTCCLLYECRPVSEPSAAAFGQLEFIGDYWIRTGYIYVILWVVERYSIIERKRMYKLIKM
jgi:hypothetical protein